MSELSHFENESAKTPVKQPIAIIVGAALVPVLLWIINILAPTDAVDDLKKKGKEEAKGSAPVEAPIQAGEVEDI